MCGALRCVHVSPQSSREAYPRRSAVIRCRPAAGLPAPYSTCATGRSRSDQAYCASAAAASSSTSLGELGRGDHPPVLAEPQRQPPDPPGIRRPERNPEPPVAGVRRPPRTGSTRRPSARPRPARARPARPAPTAGTGPSPRRRAWPRAGTSAATSSTRQPEHPVQPEQPDRLGAAAPRLQVRPALHEQHPHRVHVPLGRLVPARDVVRTGAAAGPGASRRRPGPGRRPVRGRPCARRPARWPRPPRRPPPPAWRSSGAAPSGPAGRAARPASAAR